MGLRAEKYEIAFVESRKEKWPKKYERIALKG